MKGLILKELYNLKNFMILYYLIDVFLFAVYLITFITSPNKDFATLTNEEIIRSAIYSGSFICLGYLLVISSIIIPISNELDEKCNFDKFIISAGVDRKLIVNSKVVLGLISFAVPFVLGTICLFLPCFFSGVQGYPVFDVNYAISSFIGFVSFGLFLLTLNLLFTTALGSVKTRVISIFTTIFIIAIYIGGIVFSYELSFMNGSNALYSYAVMVPLSVVVLAVGIFFYFLSIRIYKKKQF
jgi:MFS family permease